MTLAVFGAGGQVGRALVEHAGAAARGFDRAACDIYDAAVAAASPAHLLLYVSWVFGIYGANFVKTMRRLGRKRSELRIVDDQRGGPTEARDVADAILVMATACRRPGFNNWGTYHFAGAPSVRWYGFAEAILYRSCGSTSSLVKITTREYPTPARRPRTRHSIAHASGSSLVSISRIGEDRCHE